MSRPGKQFSLLDGIGSGAGALAHGAPVDQTGNLLGIATTVMTPNVMVGHSHTNFGGKKVRFGVVSKMGGHEFDYPDLAIKDAGGNGQAYKASKGAYLHGNNNAGQAGYGRDRQFDQATLVSADLTDAQMVAFRQADIGSDAYAIEHVRPVNRDYETIREHFEEQAKEHELQKMTHLMSMGFSEEEIARKAAKDREKAIEQASKMDSVASKALSSTLARSVTDIGLSIAPGLMPNRINASSYERAVGAGTVVTKGKAAEAMRRREKIALKVEAEKPQVKVPMKHSQIIQAMLEAAGKEEHKRQEQSAIKEQQVIDHQKMQEHARIARHFAMEKAMSKK